MQGAGGLTSVLPSGSGLQAGGSGVCRREELACGVCCAELCSPTELVVRSFTS